MSDVRAIGSGAVAVTACLLLAGVFRASAPPVQPVVGVPADHARSMAASRELFTASIKPLLTTQCLKCHGGEKTRAGLDLSSREALLKGGENGEVVTPGQGKKSKLYRLTARLDEPHMPPASSGFRLSSRQQEDLARWIDLGAAYDRPLLERPDSKRPKTLVVTEEDRKFWSFRPLTRPPVPAVKNGTWARNPIDRFILAKLEEKSLAPAPRADRRTLFRRAVFDLVGLPPAPDEVDSVEKNTDPGWYEAMLDRLLASPGHGERYARHWLDVVRFAESHGFEHDYDRPHAHTYRDFVIKALNLDLPYNDFIRWQIAGDEYAPNNPLALTATGFLGAGVHSTQITANTVEKERYDELDDIVRTMGTAMLGLTVGCARCHDHKYDPIPTQEYYRLLSTFTKTVRSDQEIELDPDQAREARDRHQAEIKRLEADRDLYEKQDLANKWRSWLDPGNKPKLSAWNIADPTTLRSSGGATFSRQADGSYLATGTNPGSDVYTVVLQTTMTDLTALRVEALAHPSMVRGGPGRAGNGNFALSDLKITVRSANGGPEKAVPIAQARATFEQAGLPVSAALDKDPRSGWAVDPQFGKNHAAVFEFGKKVGFPEGTILTLTLKFETNTGHNIGRPRFSLSSQASPPAIAGNGLPQEIVRFLERRAKNADTQPTATEEAALRRLVAGSDPTYRKLSDDIETLKKKGPAVGKVKAMICGEGLPPIRLHSQGGDFLENTHFLKRGDPNQKDGIATQGFLSILVRSSGGDSRWKVMPPDGTRTPYLRRSLAEWMSDAEVGAGHLLARVIVNRLWQHHFGVGLVNTPSDFGLQGDRPSHPELLDWLACELIDSGWRLKPIHRLIMTSSAYQQGTRYDREFARIDPQNRLLWRRSPHRLEAEILRDSILSVSGRLDRGMFGPGTLDPRQPRRSIYFFVKRSQLVPMMVLFDAPDGTVGIESRTNTTIAPQALLLLNSPLIREAAESLARRLEPSADPAAWITAGYQATIGRPPKAEELSNSLNFLSEQASSYRQAGKADAEHLAKTDFCQVLFGLNESIFID